MLATHLKSHSPRKYFIFSFFRLSNAAPSKDDCCAGKANFSVETGRRGYLLIREIEFEVLKGLQFN